MRFCILALKLLPPCGENAKHDISVTARPISKILFYCSQFASSNPIFNNQPFFRDMGYNLLILS